MPTTPSPRRAIILAAGRGTRLGPRADADAPKSLLHVAGRTLLDRHCEALSAVGVEEITLVVGHGEHLVRDAAATLGPRWGVRFRWVHNPDYAQTNTIYSKYLARQHLDAPCFCLNGDVLFGVGLLRRLLETPGSAALGIDHKPCGDEEVKVQTVDGRVMRIGKDVDPAIAAGEFVGVARYGAQAGAHFARALADTVEHEGRRTDYFEIALDRITGLVPLRVAALDEPVIEIDTAEDLDRAEREVAPRLDGARV